MNEKYLELLYKLAYKAYKKNEVPVSAILVKDKKIIAKFYNKKNIKKNPLMHAEIMCLNKAYRKLNRWNLNDCILYVTLEPCDMCKLVIEESRIDHVYFLLNRGNKTNKYNKTQYEQMYVSNADEVEKLMKNFFKKIRKK